MLRCFLLSTAFLAGLTATGHAAELKVRVTGAKPAQGWILLSVFDRADAWLRTPFESRTVNVTGAGSASVSLDLPPGRYGIAIVHDANGNGVLDTGPLRMPREAFAFSNNAKTRFGPPTFNRAAFTVSPEGAALTIPLSTAKRAGRPES